MTATTPNTQEEYGTADLASSIYPEIDSSGFKAPIAQMFNPPPLPILRFDTDACETTAALDHCSDQHALTPIEGEGRYADELALTPVRKERCKLLRSRRKQSKAKIQQTYDYAEELALSPVRNKRRKLTYRLRKLSVATKEVGHAGVAELALSSAHENRAEPPLRGWQHDGPKVAEVYDSITVENPEEQEEASESQEATN
ncbi:hypothetical protein N431DRAFT_451136 [Stipitochalara longipes BDJ]|nr:hypothetical protein N431DRAFT_451136 [Stipitochalara longipes BDJ]